MTLSENAAKGKKTAALVSAMCFALAAMSLLTVNILMAAVDFAVAYHIKRGSLTARNLAVILRTAHIPVLVVVSEAFRRYGTALPIPSEAVTVLIAAAAVLDVSALLMLIFSKNAGAYFHETEDAANNDVKP